VSLVTRTHATSSSRIRCLASIRGLLDTIRRTSPKFAHTFMLVIANTPRPVSKVVVAFVHTARVLAYVHGLEFDTNAKCTPEIGSRFGRCSVSDGSLRALASISLTATRM